MITISSICYHYIARGDEFKRIWGHSFELFKEHIDFFKKNKRIIDPQDVLHERFEEGNNYILLTFDDGLKEHIRIADYLDSLKLKGIFAIPTCILREEPSNPQIIHFGSAYYGIRKFYSFVAKEIESNFSQDYFLLAEKPNRLDINELHRTTKDIFKRRVAPVIGRRILLNIFNNKIKKDFPNFMELVHLNKKDIVNLVKKGHTVAVHSDTHPVVRNIETDKGLISKEIMKSKASLSGLIGREVEIFAYPFGEKNDIINDTTILTEAGYKQILTTYQAGLDFNQLNLGRYCSQSQDQAENLANQLWKYKVK